MPATLTADQVREVNARNAVECELIDEALGRVLGRVAERGWGDDLDVFFTTDHGELQGDFGLLFKGPYHVDALMRLPLIWRPAPSATVSPAVVAEPVGLVDLAPTFCAIADVDPPEWMEGAALPVDDADATRGVSTGCSPSGTASSSGSTSTCAPSPGTTGCAAPTSPGTSHDGTEGELYDLDDDPLQRLNRWDDPALRARARRPGGRPVGPPASGPAPPARPRSTGLSPALGRGRPQSYRRAMVGELRSKMIRNPWRVSHGSTYSISSE